MKNDTPYSEEPMAMASVPNDTGLGPDLIFLLPPELMDMVFSYLSVLSGASLAMTCKVYYKQFGFILKRPELKCPRPINKGEPSIPLEQYLINPSTGFYQRTELLLPLESDKLTFCGECNYLYPSNQFIWDSGMTMRWHIRDGIDRHQRERLFSIVDDGSGSEEYDSQPLRYITFWGAELGELVQDMEILETCNDRITLELDYTLCHRYNENRLYSPKQVQPIMVCPHVNVVD
ncbi:uncharacterized protein N7515_006893 [Penicillium bovifimosum]|uniref:F-box domain-containing protein n=1 Tax=Penicillium bovifimosum TaxID=126998 RepID=A0A9W9GX25_9EURO|nr:uncharacterized protein N7515_006893 [Penicillium bovifimosum]KAJ5130854.1 hypothetical protein N7515_006893 [Penicillium bovifimosum]